MNKGTGQNQAAGVIQSWLQPPHSPDLAELHPHPQPLGLIGDVPFESPQASIF